MARGAVVLAASAACAAGAIVARRLTQRWRLNRLLNGNLSLFGGSERRALEQLARGRHAYVLRHWPARGTSDEVKRALVTAALAVDGEEKKGSEGYEEEMESLRLGLLTAPAAARRAKELTAHGDTRVDEYYWLRDDEREAPEVLAHLAAENAHTAAALADTEGLQATLYAELRGRIQEADSSVPTRFDDWQYYSRTEEGAQYGVHCRRRLGAGVGPPSEADPLFQDHPEEVLLDENAEAARHKFYMLGGFAVSPDHALLAYTADTVGGEKYALRVKDLASGRDVLARPIPDTAGGVAWANDNATLFYVTKDALDRPDRVWRHALGTDPGADVCVFHEPDEAFYVGLSRSRSDRLLYIHSGSAVTSDVRWLSADEPLGEWHLVLPREQGVDYSVADRGNYFYVTRRDPDTPNSAVLLLPRQAGGDAAARLTLLAHRADVKLEGIELCATHLVSFERREGLQQAVVHALPGEGAPPAGALGFGTAIAFEEPAYELGAGGQGDWDSPLLRLVYTSLKTPTTVIDYNLLTGARATKKVQPVRGGYDAHRYVTVREWAVSADGARVPISLVYRSDLVQRGSATPAPLLLDAYGSYEICNDPDFRASRLSLLDRGWAFAIAHVRGGGEMGRQWYESGKFLSKANTFADVIACAEHLVARRWTDSSVLCLEGRSAGGLTVGATVNARPDLFRGVVMGVPFVDCLTTMLDETIPLTTVEWEEWGDPRQRPFYDAIKAYSPVDNIPPPGACPVYPHALVTAGLHDPRVGYWEPAKYVARLRASRDDGRLLLFKCDLGAGHFSQSGRFDKLKERALELAFLLKVVGMRDVKPM